MLDGAEKWRQGNHPMSSILPATLPWRVAAVLTLGCLAGSLAILPQMLTLAATADPSLTEGLPPWPLLLLVTALQSLVVFGLAATAGLAMAQRLRHGPDLLMAWLYGRPAPDAWARLRDGLALGLASGIVLGLVQGLLVQPLMPPGLSGPTAPLWMRLLGGMLYGGIAEEVLLRLLVVSGLVLLLQRLTGRRPSPRVWWSAILVAAVLFGVLHLPVVAAMGPLTPPLAAAVTMVNASMGLVFGWLYWWRGLEAAMLAHAAAHLPLQLIVGMVA
ncbi:MAG TPA: CPBP family glutamic-type intramembrane protease [Azospirillaceae bacterium]|nr:CPBP family glutamic-type intramembrane protease [Azospirillaceae bacterium]